MKKIDLFIGTVALLAFFLLMAELSSYFDAYAGLLRIINIIILFLFILDVVLRFLLVGSGLALSSGTTFNGSATLTITNSGVTNAAAGTGISLSAGTGSITITNSGVTSNIAGTGISVSGATGGVTITNTGVTSAVAGSGISLSGGTGAVTITNSGITAATAGSGISITGSGSITIANSGVTSITGTTNQVVASAGTGGVTLSLPQSINTTSNVQFNSLGIGTAASGTAGEIRATDNVTAYYSSDERLKTNITKIDGALEKISQIDGVIYDWNETYLKDHGNVDGYFVRERNSGVIAQQVEKVFPNVVADRADGYKAVRYELLVPLLIEAIKELKQQIAELKK